MSAFLSSMSPAVAILAGGLGTRLWPVTAAIPKSMLMVAGEPFIAHQLRLLSRQGLQDVVICGGHLLGQIEDFVGDGDRFGCRVCYSSDGPVLLGTGGAIRQALPLLGTQFFVLYGDSYLTAPFAPILHAFAASGRQALMTILRNRGQWDASNVEFAGGEVIRYDKHAAWLSMEHIDYGLSLFSEKVFLRWPAGSVFCLSALQSSLVAQGEIAAYEVGDRFYEIGSMHGWQETDAFLRSRQVETVTA
jgi:N-acetyl-alpha-D-muramate 1-phosphate uridylyltransferase